MKKMMLAAWAVICFSGITIAQQDTTKMNQDKTQKEQKDTSKKKDSKSSKKNKRDKVDSVNSNMDTTSRIESR